MSRKLLVVFAVLVLVVVPMTVLAGNQGGRGDYNKDIQWSANIDVTLQAMAYANLALETYSVDVDIDVGAINGILPVYGLVEAVSKNDQFPEKNVTFNYEADNNATIADSSFEDFTGNLGVNVAAGNSNTQSNIATYAAGEADASLTRATIFSVQKAMENLTKNEGSANNATIAGSVLEGATGNVGMNVAAGNNNAQTNLTAIAVAPANVGMALAYVQQKSLNNATFNGPTYTFEPTRLESSFDVTGALSFGDGESPNFTLYQVDNFYLDTWTGATHPAGDPTGHIDMDSNIQGAVLNPYRDDQTGTGDLPIGGIAFEGRIPDAELNLTFTGYQDVLLPVLSVKTVNNATISANTLSNLTGNFGINVVAGNNNMQANAFAACYVPAVAGTPGGENGGNGGGGER
ncbi:MAG: hypothetical protein GX147_04200 [Deltaproteobacteria bacterium]|nr:hypothetical protein [Deltaproteobacteria bacterium]